MCELVGKMTGAVPREGTGDTSVTFGRGATLSSKGPYPMSDSKLQFCPLKVFAQHV